MNVRTQFPDLFLTTMLPAIDEVIFTRFRKWPEQYSRVFRTVTSGRSIEQTTEVSGLGLPVQIAENGAMRYDAAVPGFDKTYTHVQFGLGFKISRIMVDDDKFNIARDLATDLGRSFAELIEIEAASDFNNGFSGSFLGPDGVALFSTAHPLVKASGTQTNTLSAAADLDIPSLELALTDFRKMRDPSGKKARLRPSRLVIPPEYEFVASEILMSPMRADTANNAVNAFKHRIGQAAFDEVVVWEYLTDPDAWFVVADPAETQLRFYWRERPDTVHDVDFDTRGLKTAMWCRFSHGWSNFYGTYGSPGA